MLSPSVAEIFPSPPTGGPAMEGIETMKWPEPAGVSIRVNVSGVVSELDVTATLVVPVPLRSESSTVMFTVLPHRYAEWSRPIAPAQGWTNTSLGPASSQGSGSVLPSCLYVAWYQVTSRL